MCEESQRAPPPEYASYPYARNGNDPTAEAPTLAKLRAGGASRSSSLKHDIELALAVECVNVVAAANVDAPNEDLRNSCATARKPGHLVTYL